MLKKLILVLGLASSLISAVPQFVQSEDILTNSQIDEDATHTGSTSVNSCYVRELPNRAPTFRHTLPDVCVTIEALHKLKIYSFATCRNGTEALLALYDAPGCVGEPARLKTSEEASIRTCLSMPSQDDGSYGFWCEGVLEAPPGKSPSPQPSQPSSGGGSIWGLIGILLLIFATMLLIAIIKLVSFISRATNAGNKFLGIFGQREGAIAL